MSVKEVLIVNQAEKYKCYESIRKHKSKLSVINQSVNTDKSCQSLIDLKPRTTPMNIPFIRYIIHMNLAQGQD